MEELHALLHSLSSNEWASFQKYLTTFTEHNSSRLKSLRLAKLLINLKNTPSHASCCISLYGTKKEHSFDELKSSLKEKILDFLLTDISADKQETLDEADLMIIKINKKSAQFRQLFYSKKRIHLFFNLLDEIISLAKKYEQYSLLVDHLRHKKVLINWKLGKKDFEKINEEMRTASEYSILLNKAEHYYYELMMVESFSGKPDKQKALLTLKKNIEEIQAGFEFTNSPMVHYYLKNLEMGYSQLKEDYFQARSVCLELLNIVRNNKSVYRRQRVGVVYDNLSRCEFYLGNFKQAMDCAREGQKLFNQASENYCIALEQEFYALFAMKQYGPSTDIANKMIASATRKELGEFRYSKYNYLLANAFFKQRRFSDALHLLSQSREISKDKNGWEIGARMLTIMSLIETLKLDEASMAILSLKQFLKRTDKKTPVSQRDKTILNLLLSAERKGFAFTMLNGNTEKYMAALQSGDEKTRWEPFTHEVIPFHEWFAEKMGKAIPSIPQHQKEFLTASERKAEILKTGK